MKKKHFLVTLLIFWSYLLTGQFTINGTFTGLSNEKVTLLQTFGNDRRMIDTARMDADGSFNMKLPEDLPAGMYRLLISSGMNIALICHGENIRFVAYPNEYGTYVQVIESVENMIYYDFMNLKKQNLYKLDVLSPVVQYYPDKDPFYTDVAAKVQQLREEVTTRADELTRENQGTLAVHFLAVEKPVFAPMGANEEETAAFLRSHYFDDADFADTVLLRSDVLNRKMIDYLSLYQDRNADREAFENSLLQGVDSLLDKAVVNQQMYTYVVDFLVEGFEAVGFEKGLDYISEHNQLDEFCTNTERLAELQDKMELINRLAIGKKAPDFTQTTTDGKEVHLYNLVADKTLLVFWASWCPHCRDIVPEINRINEELSGQGVKVIGISVDTSLQDLQTVMEEYHITWPVIAEGDGWEGMVPELYGISATPTMFLLDDNKKIIAKPINKRDLQQTLSY